MQEGCRVPTRNVVSACLGVLVITTLCVSLFHPKWFFLTALGRGHNLPPGQTSYYIGVQNWFHPPVHRCASNHAVNSLQNVIIVVTCLTLLSSLTQFLLDACDVDFLQLRRNAVPSVISVILCVTCIGVAYHLSCVLTRCTANAAVQVSFALSYYLQALSGVLATFVAGVNLVVPPSSRSRRPNLLMYEGGFENDWPPLPPYTP